MVGEREPVAMEIPAEEGAAAARGPPRRIRRRLVEGARGGGAPASVEEIEARLRDAELRRQVRVTVVLSPFPLPPFPCSAWRGSLARVASRSWLGCVAGE
jgi:hypothetical protein